MHPYYVAIWLRSRCIRNCYLTTGRPVGVHVARAWGVNKNGRALTNAPGPGGGAGLSALLDYRSSEKWITRLYMAMHNCAWALPWASADPEFPGADSGAGPGGRPIGSPIQSALWHCPFQVLWLMATAGYLRLLTAIVHEQGRVPLLRSGYRRNKQVAEGANKSQSTQRGASKDTKKATFDEEGRKLTRLIDRALHAMSGETEVAVEPKGSDCAALRPLVLKIAKVYKPCALVVKKTELMEGLADTHGIRTKRKEDIVD